jgi:hypothetical protein
MTSDAIASGRASHAILRTQMSPAQPSVMQAYGTLLMLEQIAWATLCASS